MTYQERTKQINRRGVEIGRKCDDGSWELITDETEGLQEVGAIAAILEAGDGTYGIDSSDGGHYETFYEVEDGRYWEVNL